MLHPVPPTDCMRAREGASAWLDGELGELDRARLEAHLADCADCRAFADAIGRAARELRNAALEVAPPALFVPHRRRPAVPRVAAAAAAALLVAAAAGSSFFLGRQVGLHGVGHAHRVATTAGTRTDPALVAMLRGSRAWPSQNHRAVAL